MWNKEKDKDTMHHDEERYQFIKEQVQPQRRLQVQKWAKYFGGLLASALLFGLVAGGVIVLLQNRFAEPKEQISNMPEYSAEPEETTKAPEGFSEKKDGKGISFSEMNHFTKRLAEVGDKAKVSLVGISKENSAKDWPEEQKSEQTMGYGVIIEETKTFYYILTDRNIVKGHRTVTVYLMDDTTVEGTVLGSDTHLDLAVLRISRMEIKSKVSGQMKAVKIGEKAELSNGLNVIAVGAPNGVLNSVVTGRVTNDSVCAGITDGEIQLYCTDIPYSQEGSGIVLNTAGKIVGVVATVFTEKTGTAGMAFIGVTDVLNVFELLKQQKSAPYMGIEGSSLEADVAKVHQLRAGAYITEVYYGSPAYRSGMRVADVITMVDKRQISGMQEFYQVLLTHTQGDVITCTVSRKTWGAQIEKKLKITLQ